MRVEHPIVATLLIGVIIIGSSIRVPAARSSSDLTPGEESEARALADDFIARLEAQPDLEPLIRDFFITDFAERLRTLEEGVSYPLASIDGDLVKHLGEDELRRLYVQTTTTLYFMARYVGAATYTQEQSQCPDEKCDLGPREALPPEVFALLKSDPTLAETLGPIEPPEDDAVAADSTTSGQNSENSPNPGPEAESTRKTIKTREDLERYLAALEKLNSLMKPGIKNLPSLKSLVTVLREKTQAESEDELGPQVTILPTEWFGFPEGTRVICIMALLFHMDLVREHGRLKIATIYLPNSCGR